MAARHAEDVPELAEELQPLAGEVQAPRTGHRTKVALALGLGLAAAATYTLTPHGKTETQRADARLDGVQGKFGKFFKGLAHRRADKKWGTGPLTLEGDMGKFIEKDALPEEANPRLGVSLGDTAATLFEHVVEKSSVGKEMAEKELSAYKLRFITAMVNMANSNKGAQEDFVERAKKHIQGTKPVMTESLAAVTNNRQRAFKTEMKDWMTEESVDSFEARLIKVPFQPPAFGKVFKNQLPVDGFKDGKLPINFESASFWPKCAKVIESPHNQGRCGSCWVFGALGALDSRLCIATDGEFSGPNAVLSRGMGASCAADWDGCQGGWPHLVYDFMEKNGGIASTNCDPYFGGSDFAHHWNNAMGAPACPKECDSRFPQTMSEDLVNPPGIVQYRLVDSPNEQGIFDLKNAIFNEGPVSYALYANHAFMGYTSGVFDQDCGHQANHAVQAIGFGKELGKEYIQSLNSWGTHWGDKGRFKVANCVIWHYVIPGSILKGGTYPFPIPDLKK